MELLDLLLVDFILLAAAQDPLTLVRELFLVVLAVVDHQTLLVVLDQNLDLVREHLALLILVAAVEQVLDMDGLEDPEVLVFL
jgi:hypothetical protein